MKRSRRVNLIRKLLISLSALAGSGCDAQHVPVDWKSDCVGRAELHFPGPVEVATNSAKTWSEALVGGRTRELEFGDGQVTWGTSLVYVGWIRVTHPLNRLERESVMSVVAAVRERVQRRKSVKNPIAVGPEQRPFQDISVTPQQGFGWQIGESVVLSLKVGESWFDWAETAGAREAESRDKNVRTILNGLRARAVGEIPAESGVCLPESFIADDGKAPRVISMAYRLVAHPDVVVMLRDGIAASASPNQRKDVLSAEYRSNDFWSQYEGIGQRVSSVWLTPYRSTTLAGQKGLVSFTEITREDGTQDFGYLAVAPGNPEAKEDKPDLMLYVIRDAKNAKAKGIEPISKEALLEMAQTIAASVKHRAVR